MANTTVASANNVQQWSERFFYEFVRDNQFVKLMGTTENAPIQIKRELKTQPGDQITISLIGRLTGAGVTGDNTLVGNEEALNNYGHKITIDQKRHAGSVGHAEQKKTHLDLLKAASMMLKLWSSAELRDDLIEAMQSPNLDGSTAYASTAEVDKDLWVTAQYAAKRVLFGAAIANYSAADHSASLLNVDSAGDVLTRGIVSLAKRYVGDGSHHIRPVETGEAGEQFVLLCPTYAFRDFKSDYANTAMYAHERGKDNPLFSDGDLIWDGVIVKEIKEIPTLSGVGNGGIDVGSCFLLGAQAVGVAWGEDPHAIKESTDYDNIKGVGTAEMRGIDKLMYNSIQHGMLTLYVANVADS